MVSNLPEGFVLDSPSSSQGDNKLPQGFVLDSAPGKETWTLQNLFESAKRGNKQAALGFMQALGMGGDALRPEFAQMAQELNQQGEGTGTLGFLGELLGDPKNIALGAGGLPVRAVGGAVTGAFTPVEQVEGQAHERLKNTAKTAALFAGAPIVVEKAISAVPAVAKAGAEFASDLFAKKELPKELQTMQPLLDAKGGTLFSKAPNDLDSGLKANQDISQQYDIAKNKVAQSEITLRGTPIEVESTEFMPKIKQNIAFLSKKVAPGSNDAQALKALKGIIKKTESGKAPSTDTFGVPDAVPTINSNTALEIRKSINDIMQSPTFPSSGQAVLLRIKKLADDVLDKGASTSQDFATKWDDYKVTSQDVAKRFTNNDSIKSFWQPEDYVAWKAAQNNPSQSAISDATFSRANKILSGLNTKDAGKVSAIINALPEDVAKQIMRDAVVKANKEKISITNAAIQTLTGSPIKGLQTLGQSLLSKSATKEMPINKLIKDLEQRRIKK